MIESSIAALILADPTIISIIGTRLYPTTVPEANVGPCLVYQGISGLTDRTLGLNTIRTKRIQYDAYSLVYADTRNILQALDRFFDSFSGTLIGGERVLGAWRDITLDKYVATSKYFRSINQYSIQYVEASS